MGAMLWLKFKRLRSDVPLYAVMMLMAIFLSFIVGRAMFGESEQRVFIIDEDQSAFSEAFTEALDNDTYQLIQKETDEVQKAVEKGEGLAALILPEGFGQSSSSQPAQLTLIRTADSPDVLALQNAVQAAYRKAVHPYVLHAALETALLEMGIGTPSRQALETALNTRIERVVTVNYSIADADGFDETFENNIHFIMGFNIFFVIFSVIFTMGGLLEDKKLFTWGRIRISPISSAAVLAGHFVPAYLVGILQMSIVLFAGQALFGIDLRGQLLPVLAVFAVFVLTIVCLGLLLAIALRTIDQMGAVTPVITVSTSMLGGCMWPLSIVSSQALLTIANAMPQKWALEAVKSITVYNNGFGSVLPNLAVLLGMAAVLFCASLLLYNRKQRV